MNSILEGSRRSKKYHSGSYNYTNKACDRDMILERKKIIDIRYRIERL